LRGKKNIHKTNDNLLAKRREKGGNTAAQEGFGKTQEKQPTKKPLGRKPITGGYKPTEEDAQRPNRVNVQRKSPCKAVKNIVRLRGWRE